MSGNGLRRRRRNNATNNSRAEEYATQHDLIGPISAALLVDPVRIRGEVTPGAFERKHITRWLNQTGTSPTTRIRATVANLEPALDIQQEIKLTAARIHNSTTQLVRRGRSWLIQDTLDKLSTTLKDKVPKPLQAPTGEATSALANVIFCNLEKIQEGLADYLSKSLENMIGQVLDVPACGIENFLSDMFGQINGIIDNDLGSMFSQLNSIQGGGIGAPSDTFSKAIKYANIITNILDCDRQNCPEPTSYSSKNGISKSGLDDFGGILEKVGLKKLETGLLNTLDNAIPAIPSAPSVPLVPSLS